VVKVKSIAGIVLIPATFAASSLLRYLFNPYTRESSGPLLLAGASAVVALVPGRGHHERFSTSGRVDKPDSHARSGSRDMWLRGWTLWRSEVKVSFRIATDKKSFRNERFAAYCNFPRPSRVS
jgi:hypothetical protein